MLGVCANSKFVADRSYQLSSGPEGLFFFFLLKRILLFLSVVLRARRLSGGSCGDLTFTITSMGLKCLASCY
jgi:hypothetical protein